jgi:hypothetical protein
MYLLQADEKTIGNPVGLYLYRGNGKSPLPDADPLILVPIFLSLCTEALFRSLPTILSRVSATYS